MAKRRSTTDDDLVRIEAAGDEAERVARLYGLVDQLETAREDAEVRERLLIDNEAAVARRETLTKNAELRKSKSPLNRFIEELLPQLGQLTEKQTRAKIKQAAIVPENLEKLASYKCCEALLEDITGEKRLSPAERSDAQRELSKLVNAALKSALKT